MDEQKALALVGSIKAKINSLEEVLGGKEAASEDEEPKDEE